MSFAPTDAAGYASFPARPPDVPEWEDLLYRMELVPRGVRNAVDDAPPPGAALLPALDALVAREAWLGEALDALREGRPLPPRPDAPPPDVLTGASAVERAWDFARLRARAFARVQRRGLEVWSWAAPGPDGGAVTAYRLLLAVAREDGAAMAALRAAAREAGAC